MLIHLNKRIFASVIIFMAFGLVTAGFSQEVSEACKAIPDLNEDFVLIDEFKSKTEREVGELESKIKDYKENKIPKYEKLEKQLERINQEIGGLEQKPTRTTDEEAKLVSVRKDRDSIEEIREGKTSVTLKGELKQFEDDHSWKAEQLQCINKSLSQMFSPQQDFKFWMSMFFAGLIALLIGGFFVIAYKDEIVRRAIFGGQSGLQFLTLFSIVIAIILFGITTILEGRELAALLGGLAGYILGKVGAPEPGIDNRVPARAVVAHVAIDPPNVNLAPNHLTEQLTIAATDTQNNPIPDLAGGKVQWNSDNPLVATVDQTGLVTRVGVGNCSVTATVNGINSNPCNVISA